MGLADEVARMGREAEGHRNSSIEYRDRAAEMSAQATARVVAMLAESVAILKKSGVAPAAIIKGLPYPKAEKASLSRKAQVTALGWPMGDIDSAKILVADDGHIFAAGIPYRPHHALRRLDVDRWLQRQASDRGDEIRRKKNFEILRRLCRLP